MTMFVNPLHPDFPARTADYEEPVALQHEDSPAVNFDSDLYIADQDNPSADGSYAEFRSPKPAMGANDANYSVFRSEGLAQDPDATA